MKTAPIDLETTGLDPTRVYASILEVHVSVTDEKLNELASFHRYVRPTHREQDIPWETICEPGALSMHTKSGLLDRCDAEGAAPDTAGDELAAFLAAHNEGDPKNLVFLGNSLASLDLPFLRAFWHHALAQAHYRTIDVSGFRLATMLAFGKDYRYEKKFAHTATSDVAESVAELKFIANSIASDIFQQAAERLLERLYSWAKEHDAVPPALAVQAELPFPDVRTTQVLTE